MSTRSMRSKFCQYAVNDCGYPFGLLVVDPVSALVKVFVEIGLVDNGELEAVDGAFPFHVGEDLSVRNARGATLAVESLNVLNAVSSPLESSL